VVDPINKTIILISGLLLALALSLGWPFTALADGSITVDTTNDEYADPDPGIGCSLREAITTANGDADENPYNFTLEGTVAESSGYLPVIFKNP